MARLLDDQLRLPARRRRIPVHRSDAALLAVRRGHRRSSRSTKDHAAVAVPADGVRADPRAAHLSASGEGVAHLRNVIPHRQHAIVQRSCICVFAAAARRAQRRPERDRHELHAIQPRPLPRSRARRCGFRHLGTCGVLHFEWSLLPRRDRRVHGDQHPADSRAEPAERHLPPLARADCRCCRRTTASDRSSAPFSSPAADTRRRRERSRC